jgi:hypothetical protein
MEDDLEALMWVTLERCGRKPEGYRLDANHPLVALLIEESILRRRKGGLMVITDQGQAILKLRPSAQARRGAPSSRRPSEACPLARCANE